ncbi:MAG: substrate-binding domain-containing protein [Candidatus Micrarchaeota archaeon]
MKQVNLTVILLLAIGVLGCTGPLQEITCGEHKIGETWKASDGCNTCTCTENGLSACTARACVNETQCNGHKLEDRWAASDGCNTCTCTERGIACTEMACADTEELNFNLNDYPKIDGSTSTHPLSILVACKLLNVSYSWTPTWDGSKYLMPNVTATEPEKRYIASNITQKIIHRNTHESYVNLIEKKADLILVARLPSDDELELAKNKGVELETHAVALDAFVFILNKNNSVTSLATKQIQDIYTGKITNWREVAGRDAKINAYQREDNSGSQELMKSLMMKDLKIIAAPLMILTGMMGPINRLSTDKDGIGYSVYYFEEFMAPNEKIKLCGVDGVIPDYESIRTRKYPYVAEVYVVIRKDLDKKSNAYKLRDWLLSDDGQEVVKESGYVPIRQPFFSNQ